MKKTIIKNMRYLVLMAVFVVCFGVTANASVVSLPVNVAIENDEAARFIQYLNEQRVSAGKNAYIVDSRLMEVARKRVAECCIFFDHGDANGDFSATNASADHKYYTEEEKRNCTISEDIGVNGDYITIYSNWYQSIGHKPLLTSSQFVSCGVACGTYEGSRYWVLLCSTKQIGSQVNSLPSGSTVFSHNVSVDTSYIIPYMIVAETYYGQTRQEPFRIRNRIRGDYVADGYVVNSSMISSLVNNNPELFTITKDGTITPKKKGTGTISVSILGSAESTINVKIKPQVGTCMVPDENGNYNALSPRNLKFSSSLSVSSYDYTGSEIKPSMTVKDWYGNTLTEGVDYTLKYTNNINPGTANVAAYAKSVGNYDDGSTPFMTDCSFQIRQSSGGGSGGNTSGDNNGGNSGNTGNTGNTGNNNGGNSGGNSGGNPSGGNPGSSTGSGGNSGNNPAVYDIPGNVDAESPENGNTGSGTSTKIQPFPKGTTLNLGKGEYVVTSKNTLTLKKTYNVKGKFSIPSKFNLNGNVYSVTAIGPNAFRKNKKLTQVTIPNTVLKIGSNAFDGCSKLKVITIKTTKLKKKNVGSNCFRNIYKKATMKLPKKQRSAYKKIFKTKGKCPKQVKYR